MAGADVLSRGPSFPLYPSADGRIAYRPGADKVRQSILLILMTQPGERPLRPEFGCNLQRYVMQPNTATTHVQIKRDVERTLRMWEPRIHLSEVGVAPGPDPATVLIKISYTHVRDGKPGSLVIPFLLE